MVIEILYIDSQSKQAFYFSMARFPITTENNTHRVITTYNSVMWLDFDQSMIDFVCRFWAGPNL